MEDPTDLYQDMEKLNALYGELCWDHDEPLDFTADYKNDRIIIRRKRSLQTKLKFSLTLLMLKSSANTSSKLV